MNVAGDDKSRYFETSLKYNYSATAITLHFPLRSDLLKFQHDITHKMTLQNNLCMEMSIFVFKLTEELSEMHSVKTQEH